MRCNILRSVSLALIICLSASPLWAQYYADDYYQQYPASDATDQDQYWYQGANTGGRGYQAATQSPGLQYDHREAEAILRDQYQRGGVQAPQQQSWDPYSAQPAQNYYEHRLQTGDQAQRVMAEARSIGNLVKGNRNGKAFIVMDKRNFQFYLYGRDARLLRIGPVAIGKGKTQEGSFETPVGVFPIKSKIPVADWIRPDWYFKEEKEPIPQRWEDRRVPGFFRYKLVFDGSRYIHYAEATGGRLTHGCLGLDWLDAEAVFHTLDVGSYCIIIDPGILTRIARGEFPIVTAQAKPEKKQEDPATVAAPVESEQQPRVQTAESDSGEQEHSLGNLW